MNKKNMFKSLLLMCLLALPLNTLADNYKRGDCDRNGEVNIADVSALIDYLLTDQWTDDPATYDLDAQVVQTRSCHALASSVPVSLLFRMECTLQVHCSFPSISPYLSSSCPFFIRKFA